MATKKYFNFDGSLAEYINSWLELHRDELTEDKAVEFSTEIVEEWAIAPIDELGGKTPENYFESFDIHELLDALRYYIDTKIGVSNYLLDALTDIVGAEGIIADEVLKETELEYTTTLMMVLESRGYTALHKQYLQWILDSKKDEDLRYMASQVLSETPDKIAPYLEETIAIANNDAKAGLADIVVRLPKTEYGFKLLVQLLLEGNDLPLYANYLGMYGDFKAISYLIQMAQNCDYASYIEIRNAVEELGGNMVVNRDFSQDPTFKRISENRNR